MASLIATLARRVAGPAPEIRCASKVWRRGVVELRRRAAGRRESGAFLLGSNSNAREIEEFVYYDDIDPNALNTGMVVIDGRCLGDLWSHCRRVGRSVVADIHVHPGSFGQSPSDRANPVIAEVGHMAMILPDFAERETGPEGIGVYEYLGSRRWLDRSFERPSPLHIGWSLWR